MPKGTHVVPVSPESAQLAEWLEGTTLLSSSLSARPPSDTLRPNPLPLRCVVDAIHDGDQTLLSPPIAAKTEIRDAFDAIRAQGTSAFAKELSSSLGAAGVVNLRVARVTLDLDKLPGIDMTGRDRAIGSPVATYLSEEKKRSLIQIYRSTLVTLAEARRGSKLWISIMSRNDSQRNIQLHWKAPSKRLCSIDPLVPRLFLGSIHNTTFIESILSALGEYTDPIECHPALASDSLAVRASAFDWMQYLQEKLEQFGPGRNEIWDDASRELWAALLDTGGLSAETLAIRAFLDHRLEAPPAHRQRFYALANRYKRATQWINSRMDELIREYPMWPKYQQGLVIKLPTISSPRLRAIWVERLTQGIRDGLNYLETQSRS